MTKPKVTNETIINETAGTQTRTIAWTYNMKVSELRGWINALPDQANISMWVDENHSEMGIGATWEVT